VNDNTQKEQLEKLRTQRDAKFDEIVVCLSRDLYPLSASASHRERIIEEAEELTDEWAVAEADSRSPDTSTELQTLLGEHQEICKRILAIIDFG
jgi:hypothetical protein